MSAALLPTVQIALCDLDIVATKDVAHMEGRRTESVISLTPYWRLSLETRILRGAALSAWESFLLKMARGGTSFVAHDVFRPRPRKYGCEPLSGSRASGGDFDGTGTLVLVNSPVDVTIGGLPSGFEMEAGCYVGFRKSAYVRSLHRIVEESTSDGSGQANVKITPPLHAGFTASNTTVDLEKPGCVMSLDSDISMPHFRRGTRRASFSATEVFFS